MSPLDAQKGCLAVPTFSKDGRALTQSQRLASAEKKGLCSGCGIQTHKVKLPLRKKALTNDHVYRGQCLRCFHERTQTDLDMSHSSYDNRGLDASDRSEASAVPENVYSQWKQRNGISSSRNHQRLRSSTGARSSRPSSSSPITGKLSVRSSVSSSTKSQHHPLRLSETSAASMATVKTGFTLPPASQVLQHSEHLLRGQDHLHLSKRSSSTGHSNHSTTRTECSSLSCPSSPISSSRSCACHSRTSRASRSPVPSRASRASRSPVPNRASKSPLRRLLTHPPTNASSIASDLTSQKSLPVMPTTNNTTSIPSLILPLSLSDDDSDSSLNKSITLFGEEHRTNTPESAKEEIAMGVPVREGGEEVLHASRPGLQEEDDGALPPGSQSRGSGPLDFSSNSTDSLTVLRRKNIVLWLQETHSSHVEIRICKDEEQQVMDTVIAAMKVSNCNPTVQRNGSSVLHHYCSSDHHQESWAPLDEDETDSTVLIAQTLLLTLAFGNLEDCIVAENAGFTFYHLVPSLVARSHNDKKAEILLQSVMDTLISSLERQLSHPPAQEAMIKALCQCVVYANIEVVALKRVRLIGTLQNCMQKQPNDQVLQKYACRIFKVLISDEDGESTIAYGSEILPMVFQIIGSNKSREVQQEAFEAAYHGTLRNNAVGYSEIASIIAAMRAHKDDLAVQSNGCGILKTISVSKASVAAIMGAKGVEAIVQAMKHHVDDSLLNCRACGALKHLASNDENELKIQLQGGIDAVVQALKSKPLDSDLQCDGFSALANLSLRAETRAALAEQDCLVEMLSAALFNFDFDTNMLRKVCNVLLNVSGNGQFATLFDKNGGVKVLAATMSQHVDDIQMQQIAIGALKNISKKSSLFTLASATEAVQASMEAMNLYPGNVKLQSNAIGLLKNASLQKENAKKVSSLGGILAILNAMEMHLLSATLQQEGCLALMNLSRVREIGEAIVAKGGTFSAIEAMREHEASAAVQNAGCGLLWNLSATATSSLPLIASEGGVDAVLVAMKKHRKASDVQQKACLALCNLVPNDECLAVMESESQGMLAALEAMRAHPSDGHVQKYACRFLAGMLRYGKREMDVRTASNGLAVVKAALEAHSDNTDLKKHANKVVAQLQHRLR